MRIEGIPLPYLDRVSATKGPGQGSKQAPVAGDQAAVSAKAQTYQALLAKVKEMPEPADKERLQNLTEAVAQGTYQVHSHEIARKLLGL